MNDPASIIVVGLEKTQEWCKIFDALDEEMDLEIVEEDICNTARKALAEHPEIGCIVLECTDLPPFARRMREEFDIPVFDFNTMAGYMAMALSLVNMY